MNLIAALLAILILKPMRAAHYARDNRLQALAAE
jgi:hypothetical protein